MSTLHQWHSGGTIRIVHDPMLITGDAIVVDDQGRRYAHKAMTTQFDIEDMCVHFAMQMVNIVEARMAKADLDAYNKAAWSHTRIILSDKPAAPRKQPQEDLPEPPPLGSWY